MKQLSRVLAITTITLGVIASSSAHAHGIWFAQRANQLAMIYGVGADDLDMVKRLEKIVSFSGYDENWNTVDAELTAAGPIVLVGGDDFPVAVSAVMDNGVWSKTADGKWHAKGKDEVPDAIISQKTMKYAVHYRGILPRNIPGLPTQRLQIIPVAEGTPALRDGKYDAHGDSMPVQIGDHLKVRVVFDGEPVAGALITRDFVNDPDAQAFVTAEDGTVTLRVRNQGLNVIGATYIGEPDQPERINEIEHFATLSFVLPILPE